MPLITAPKVDLNRYAGRWYEIARLSNRFQRDEEKAIADYTPDGPDRLKVRNTAVAPDGRQRSIEGFAEPVPGSNGARLRVRFSGWAALAPVPKEGNYWIIDLDADYQTALVGTPDRNYLWILSRSPQGKVDSVRRFTARAERFGFAINQPVWDDDRSRYLQ